MQFPYGSKYCVLWPLPSRFSVDFALQIKEKITLIYLYRNIRHLTLTLDIIPRISYGRLVTVIFCFEVVSGQCTPSKGHPGYTKIDKTPRNSYDRQITSFSVFWGGKRPVYPNRYRHPGPLPDGLRLHRRAPPTVPGERAGLARWLALSHPGTDRQLSVQALFNSYCGSFWLWGTSGPYLSTPTEYWVQIPSDIMPR